MNRECRIIRSEGALASSLEGLAMATILATIAMILIMSSSGVAVVSGSSSVAALVESVSGERIMDTVVDLEGFGSRIYYVESCLDAAAYIHDRFASLGLHVEYQDFTVNGFLARNVIAHLNGTDPSAPQFLFGAHYDSANILATNYSTGLNLSAPGADDDASGVAAVIELATLLSERKPKATVNFAAFGAEESGLNGSFHFVHGETSAGREYEATAILDMIGYRFGADDSMFIFTRDEGDEFATATVTAVEEHNLDISVEVLVNASFTYSDHYPFWRANYPSVLVIEELSSEGVANPYYHTSDDTSDKLSVSQMEAVTAAILGAYLGMTAEPGDDFVTAAAIGVAAASLVGVASYFIIRRRRAEA